RAARRGPALRSGPLRQRANGRRVCRAPAAPGRPGRRGPGSDRLRRAHPPAHDTRPMAQGAGPMTRIRPVVLVRRIALTALVAWLVALATIDPFTLLNTAASAGIG